MVRSTAAKPRRKRPQAPPAGTPAAAHTDPAPEGQGKGLSGGAATILPIAGGGLPTAAMLMRAPLEWLVDGLIPRGRLTLVAGDTGAGKTALYTSLIGHVTGGPTLDGSARGPKGTALVYMPEDDWEGRMLDSLELAAADLDRVVIGHPMPPRPPPPLIHLPDRAAALRERIERSRAALAILDPLTCYLSPGVSPRDETGVRAVLMSLLDLCRATGCTILATCHLNKRTIGSILDRISGSREWSQVPRHVLTLGRHPHDPGVRVISPAKCGSGSPGLPRVYTLETAGAACVLRLGAGQRLTSDDLAQPPESEVDRDARADARDWLRALLEEGEVRWQQIQTAAMGVRISERTLRRAKLDLAITSHHAGVGLDRHMVWRRPDKWPE